MQIKRKNIFKQYKWLKEKNKFFIISADYDGLICASFLHHHLNWKLSGYYDYNSIWLSEDALKNKKDLIWVDLNILPSSGKSIGSQIVTLNKNPIGLKTSCNPNIINDINSTNFNMKFPFSTLLFLMWLHKINYRREDIGKLLILNSDNSWMKIQKYSKNIDSWINILSNFNWEDFKKNINTIDYENKIDQYLYPKLINIGAVSGYSKLTSKYLNIRSRECKFNPDWDSDVILKLFNLFAENLKWTPPKLPEIIKRIEGKKLAINIDQIEKIGLDKFLKKYKVFSYAITSPKIFKYTIFNKYDNAKS
tara:strand:- start:1859 stop:2779 length:921 start_codon:yes stop_codon:yes gene_type:complete